MLWEISQALLKAEPRPCIQRAFLLEIFFLGGFFVKDLPKHPLSEFADHKTIANCLKVPVYFAHPHSPWERGTNEHTNRLLRQVLGVLRLSPIEFCSFYTKNGQRPLAPSRPHLAVFSEENEGRLHCIVPRRLPTKNNTRPRKCLGFATPAERFNSAFRDCISKLNFSKKIPINNCVLLKNTGKSFLIFVGGPDGKPFVRN